MTNMIFSRILSGIANGIELPMKKALINSPTTQAKAVVANSLHPA